MKNKVLYGSLIIILAMSITGCNSKLQNNTKENIDIKEPTTYTYKEVIKSVKITIDDKEYKIDLEDNETVNSFVNLLPQEFSMNELNGNEKYIYLDTILPTN
jgi:hypothetical protein